MKKYFALLVIGFLSLFCFSLYAGQDSDIVWQKYIWPSACGEAKFSPDGKFIYAAIDSGIVKLNALTGDSISTFEGKHSGLDGFNMDISALGNYIVTESYDGKAIIWDCRNEKIYNNLSETLGKPVSCICIDPLERFVLFGLGDYFEVYDIKTLNKITSFQNTGINMSSSLVAKISHDGSICAIVSWFEDSFTKIVYNSINLYTTGNWKKISEVYNTAGSKISNFNLKFSFNDSLIGFVRPGGSVAVINRYTKKTTIFRTDVSGKLNYCNNIEFLPDNTHYLLSFANLGGEYSTYLYDLQTEKPIKQYNYPDWKSDCDQNTGSVLANNYDWLTFINPTFTSISFNDNTNNDLKVLFQNNKIVLEFSTNITGNVQLFITDINGKNVYQQDIGFVNQENAKYYMETNIPSGIYLCKVIFGQKVFSQKFEIVR